MERECRIGSLAWFAGVWWLGLSVALNTMGWGMFCLRNWTADAALLCARLAGECAQQAVTCAREGAR